MEAERRQHKARASTAGAVGESGGEQAVGESGGEQEVLCASVDGALGGWLLRMSGCGITEWNCYSAAAASASVLSTSVDRFWKWVAVVGGLLMTAAITAFLALARDAYITAAPLAAGVVR